MWVGLGLFALAGAAYWNAHRIADQTIAEHRARFQEEERTLFAVPRARPPLLEPAMPGDAATVIEAFRAALSAVPRAEEDRLTPNIVASSSPAVPEEEDRILAAHPQPIAALAPLLHVPATASRPTLGDCGRTPSKEIPTIQRGTRWLQAAALRAI